MKVKRSSICIVILGYFLSLYLFFSPLFLKWEVKDLLLKFELFPEYLAFLGLILFIFFTLCLTYLFRDHLYSFFSMHPTIRRGIPVYDADSKQHLEQRPSSSRFHTVVDIGFIASCFFLALVFIMYPNHKKRTMYNHFYCSLTRPPKVRYKKVIPSPDPQGDSLKRTKLPIMELKIPRLSHVTLHNALPKIDPELQDAFSIITGVSNWQWPYVPAFFTYKGRKHFLHIRYRGWNMDHYMLSKKSWRLSFLKNDYFYGLRHINIINPRGATMLDCILANELLQEAGILVPNQFLVHFRINGKFAGIQDYVEQPDWRFLVKHNRVAADVYGEKMPLYKKEAYFNPNNWQKYSAWKDKTSCANLMELYNVIFSRGTPEYKNAIADILDVDQYLLYCAHAAISSDPNPSSHNIRWIYDPILGRFQIIPWYQSSFFISNFNNNDTWIMPFGAAINDVFAGLFAIPEYRQKYYRKTWELLNTTHEAGRIIAKIDELHDLYKEDVYADSMIHWGAMAKHYMSNALWEDKCHELKELVVKRDTYLRDELTNCNLTVFRSHDNREKIENELRENYNGLHYCGEITLISTGRVNPLLRSIKIRVECPPNTSMSDFVLIDPEKNKNYYASSLDSKDTNFQEITFFCNKEFEIETQPKSQFLTAGIYVSTESERCYGPVYSPVKTTSTLILAHKSKKKNPSASAMHFQITDINAYNTITEEPIKVHSGTCDDKSIKGVASFFKNNTPVTLNNLPFKLPLIPHKRTPEHDLDYLLPEGVHLLEPEEDIKHTIVWEKGKKKFTRDFIVPKDTKLIIMPGAVLEFEEGCSLWVKGLIEAQGSAKESILFTCASPHKNWGVVGVSTGYKGKINKFKYCIFEKGSNAKLGRVTYTGTVSLYLAEGIIEHCIFRNNNSDDGFNSCYISPTIIDSTFIRNQDGIDIDFGGGLIKNCLFTDNQGDSIDISSSWAEIVDNRINNSVDKGVSVGEKSKPIIFNNVIYNCDMGIAVKDLSNALIVNNTITHNRLGIALYQKKKEFGPGQGQIINCIVVDNRDDIRSLNDSKVTVEYSCLGQSMPGSGNIAIEPGFRNSEQEDFSLISNSLCRYSGNGRLPSDFGLKGDCKLANMGYLLDE
ncbi:MAG: CotH kinase family protein [bacterium]